MTSAENDGAAGAQSLSDVLQYRTIDGPLRTVFVILTLAAVLLSVNQLFNLQLFGLVVLDNRYLYSLAGIFLCLTYIVFPLRGKGDVQGAVPWYDILLGALSLAVAGYFVWTGEEALSAGWEYAAPQTAMILSFVFWVLILEATRRTGGTIIFAIVLLFSLYPAFADKVPGPISGYPLPLEDTIAFHIISSESSFGIPMRAFGELVVGFIVFGAALQQTGGGRFFNDLALALVGQFRGGAAKVAIFASGFMGSMSGSVISNVLTTGVVSIPAMRRTGFSRSYAAGTEACASTGGVLMPPVMGTTAFVMASFLGIPYIDIALAAALPSMLYYFGLFVQLDSYAARRGLKGLERAEVPSLRETFREGWQYLFVFAVLIFVMVVFRQETLAPFYATGLLLIINQIFPRTRLSLDGFVSLIQAIGRSLAELVSVLLGVGLIVGAFSATGLAGTLVNDLLFIAGDATIVLLIMGAITSFIFGMGMTVTACYIFLAIVLAPALTQAGMNPLAVHLFIMYWGMVSFITPPVALGAFAAATIAGTGPIKAGLAAMRLGSIIYFVPFFFVLNPALIGQGTTPEVLLVLATAFPGVWLIASATQGYLAFFGSFGDGWASLVNRALLFVGGILLIFPGFEDFHLSQIELTGIALALVAASLLLETGRRKLASA
ncbi:MULTISPECIES: TRAP transporter permease [Oceanibaculum]|uniref:TRAP transporter 4TM/12TM fusion protein n=1 Tax=Oceanibaculum indicum TaxID=526216 RepID=A0A420WNE0_9PROT|nr:MULTISPECIES: TRAP transporter fused permease subunit [Oceanibaculum]MCH2395540.1 TRAP transporter fused permease subunit [Oceanibaculum sp.]RKQ72537.1 TRAP transporter 4TM/12TM fusion protein [Oceanibaculum indicum]